MEDHFEPILDEIIDSTIYHYDDLYINDNNLNCLVGEYLEEMK